MVLPGKSAPAQATVYVSQGKISKVVEGSGSSDFDYGDLVIMPGVVDTHAHINEPGRTDWEGFKSATRAAAAGGITSVVDMPLNSIPATTSLSALQAKRAAARGQCLIDYGYWGGVIPGNRDELEPMIDAGVMGFKAFMCESGVDEFPMSDEAVLREAMPVLARRGVPLIVHAELVSSVTPSDSDPRSYRRYLESRPQKWETDAISVLIRLARETGCRTHIVHLSAAEALPDLRSARAAGVPITAETCPHYLSLAAEDIPGGATQFKCAPPIRERQNREKLWEALFDRSIEFVVSDHSPCTPSLKRIEQGDFDQAWGGIAGLQFSMQVVWSELRARKGTLSQLSEWMSARTAAFIGARKGRIAPGLDADFVVWDPDLSIRIERKQIHHKHDLTPYEGRSLHGVVSKTFVRGRVVYDQGRFAEAPSGQELLREGTPA